LIGGAAVRFHNWGASVYQVAVARSSPVVQSPRSLPCVMSSTPSRGCARLRTKRPTGHLFQIQQVSFLAMICGLLTLAPALCVRWGFFIGTAVCSVWHAVIVFFWVQPVCPCVSLIQGHVGTRGVDR
jgi:hypothetical protein